MLKVLGGEQEGEFKAVASGTLPNGKPVVVNADGTVSVVGETSYSESLSSGTVYNTNNTIRIGAGFDSVNNKVIIAYYDLGTTSGQAIVGTVSGNTISFGTQVQFENANVEDITISVDTANDKVVIFYRDGGNSNYGTAIVGTVSGTSISFGTAVVFASYYSQYNSSVYDTTSGKVIVANRDGSVTDDGSAYVGTVSGTSISFGSAQTFDSGSVGRMALVYDASVDRVVVAYKTGGTVNTKVGTVSGSTMSFGSIQDHGGSNIDKVEATGDNNGTIFICYNSGNSGSQASAFLATIGTSSITKGTTVNFDTEVPEMAPIYDSAFDKYVVLYRINSPSNAGLYIVGSASGTTLTFESPVTYYNDNAEDVEIAFDSNSNKVVFVYRDSGDGGKGTARVFQNAGSLTNLTAENYIGMSRGVVDSETVIQQLGSVVDITNNSPEYFALAFDENEGKVVVAYKEGGGTEYGLCAVGTVSGTSITFGTPVAYTNFALKNTPQGICFDSSSNKVVISYARGSNGYGQSIVGTVSGNSVSFGTAVTFNPGITTWISSVFDTAANKAVVIYCDQGNSEYGTARVGTVSGTSISFGTEVVFESAQSNYIESTYDTTNNKVVIGYSDIGNSSKGTAIIGTVSGTSISFGSATVFANAITYWVDVAFDSGNNKAVFVYTDGGNSSYGTAIVGTISGDSISFGSEAVFNTATTVQMVIAYDSAVGKMTLAYRDTSNSNNVSIKAATVSNTSISFDSAVDVGVVNAGNRGVGIIFDSTNNKSVITFKDESVNDTSAVVFQNSGTILTRGSVADGGSARIDIIGSVSDNQLSLTAGEKYYVQSDGILGTTAGSPSVLAGTAISATELLVKT